MTSQPLDVRHSRELMSRLAGFDLHVGRLLGGLLPLVPSWEEKLEAARRSHLALARAAEWREQARRLEFNGAPRATCGEVAAAWLERLFASRDASWVLSEIARGAASAMAAAQGTRARLHALADAPAIALLERATSGWAELARGAAADPALASELAGGGAQGSAEVFPRAPASEEAPARDERFHYASPGDPALEPELQDERHAMLWFLHGVANTEMHAGEIAGRNLVESAGLPFDFYRDFAEQAWDETRHAHLFMGRLVELGGRIGMFPVVPGQYAYRARLSVLERICDMNLHSEALAIERARRRAEVLRERGDEALARLFDHVVVDEERHVKLGWRWSEELAGGDRRAVAELIQDRKRRRQDSPPLLLQRRAARYLGLSDRYEPPLPGAEATRNR